MRYILSGNQPLADTVLLVESGSRDLIRPLVESLRATWCEHASFDIATCFEGLPQGVEDQFARVYRPNESRTLASRWKLVRELRSNRYTHVGVISTGEPFFARWKLILTFALPAKVFVINENGDYFWLDRTHLGVIVRFLTARSGLADAGVLRLVARAVAFPFAAVYLLLYAAAVHTRRAVRLAARGPIIRP